MSKQSMLCLLWLLFGVVLCLASCITHDEAREMAYAWATEMKFDDAVVVCDSRTGAMSSRECSVRARQLQYPLILRCVSVDQHNRGCRQR